MRRFLLMKDLHEGNGIFVLLKKCFFFLIKMCLDGFIFELF